MAKRFIFLSLILGCFLASAYVPVYSGTNTIDDLFRLTIRKFVYVSDTPGHDIWIDYSTKVKAGKKFYGDCDDFAMTMYTLLTERGYDPVLYIVMVPETGNYHAILRVNDLLIDNRSNWVQPWAFAELEYTHIVPWPQQVWGKKVIRFISR